MVIDMIFLTNTHFFLTAFSRVFEKVSYARLHQHMNQNNVYVNEQWV